MKPWHRRVALLVAVFLAPLAFLVPLQAQTTLPSNHPATQPSSQPAILPKMSPAAWAKLDPLLVKQILTQGEATFIVYLREQTNLKQAVKGVRALPQRRVAVVQALQETAARTQQEVLAYLRQRERAGRVRDITPFWVFNGIALTGDGETLAALAERDDVAQIRANRTRRLPEVPFKPVDEVSLQSVTWNIERIRANRVWEELGITGRGVVVANMDTGVDWQHTALRDAYRGRSGDHNYNWFDFTGTYPTAPGDGHGHGTHTMGTIVGRGVDGNGAPLQLGVAPGATWIAVKIFSDSGSTDDITIHKGFQWILAPTDLNGENPDPTKAPDIVSNSWGADNGADPTFRLDLQAWRAAGIFSAFAAGNSGEAGAGSVNMPASYPEGFAIGATDPDELRASFSAEGPSFWGQIKPDVSAPGQFIRSTIPNNAYAVASGTSMATPHAAGLAALLLEASQRTTEAPLPDGVGRLAAQGLLLPFPCLLPTADCRLPRDPRAIKPTFDVADLEQFMRLTAVDLGAPGPDNETGYGRIDAFKAVRWALTAGKLAGLIRDAETGLPIPGARVVGVNSAMPEDRFSVTTDADGRYNVAVPAGRYQVIVEAFGYETTKVSGIEVFTGFITLRDIELRRLPTGAVVGHVQSASGQPILATIEVLGTPVQVQTDGKASYRLELPAGSYTLRARATGFRAATVEVTVQVGAQTVQNFSLTPAPSILLVDADRWVGDNVTEYYRLALEAAGYGFDVRPITSTENVPTVAELTPYDVVIWVHAWSSPGFIDRQRENDDAATVNALTGYLDRGGRLLLIGEDIGYWDGGGDPQQPTPLPYYRDYLHARFGQDTVSTETVRGLEGDVLDGVELSFDAPFGYKSPDAPPTPDEVVPLDEAASTVAAYERGESAGLRIEADDYRVLYLSFGVRRTGPRSEIAELIAAAIDWLSQPALIKRVNKAEVMPGERITYTLTLRNAMGLPLDNVRIVDPLPAEVSFVPGSLTGGASYDADQHAVEWVGGIVPRDAVTITFQAELAPSIRAGTRITNTVRAEVFDRTLTASVAVTVIGPDLSPSVKSADRRLVLSGEVFTYTIALENASLVTATAATLVDPIPPGTTYVPGSVTGGATFDAGTNAIRWSGVVPAAAPLDAPYEWTDSDAPGGPTFAWDDRAETLGTRVSGMGDDTTTAEAIPLGFEFPFFGKVFTGFHVSSNGFICFTCTSAPFTNRRLPDPQAPGDLIAPFWDDLTLSTSGAVYTWSNGVDTAVISWVDVPRFGTGGSYTFQVILHADGRIRFQYRSLGERRDSATIGIQNSDGTQGLTIAHNESYARDGLAVLISPPRPAVPPPVIQFAVRVDEDLPPATRIANVATLDDGHGNVTQLRAEVWANLADFSTSAKEATPVVQPGGTITYTLSLVNTGPLTGTVTVVDPVPAGTSIVPGSLTGGAAYDPDANAVRWTGAVGPGATQRIGFAVRVAKAAAGGDVITNTAQVLPDVQPPFELSAATEVVVPDLSRSFKQVDRAQAASGDVLKYTISVENNSPVPAEGVTLIDRLPDGVQLVTGTLSPDAAYDPVLNAIRWSGDVPARGEGYAWDDSDMPGGPTFAWDNRAETLGVRLRDVVELGDDTTVGPFPIGFEFPFFDATYNQFWLDTNGYLTFSQAPRSDFSNDELPNPQAPGNLVAVFWDDLDMRQAGEAYYWTNGTDTLVVSWVGVPRLGSGGPYTFQAILHRSGTIIYQYREMQGTRLNEATIGIQNADGTEGLTVVYNQNYVHDGLAVRIAPPTGRQEISFQAQVAPDLPPEYEILNVVEIEDALGQVIRRQARTVVNTVDLTGVTVVASSTELRPGELVTVSVRIPNAGTIDALAQASSALPAGLEYVADSATGGAVYDAEARTVRWQGVVPAGEQVTFAYTARAQYGLADGTVLAVPITVQDGIHAPLERSLELQILAPDLSTSLKLAPVETGRGERLFYRIRIVNTGRAAAQAVLTDTLPVGVIFLPESAWAESGSAIRYDPDTRRLTWSGEVPVRGITWLHFAVLVPEDAEGEIVNRAVLTDGYGHMLEIVTNTRVVGYRFFLPLLLK